MTPRQLQECVEVLPPDIRRELDEIREIGRGPFGRAQTQQIVVAHLDLLLRLRREYHATHADLVGLLGLYGVTGPNGAALTAATLSSAISRACVRSDTCSFKDDARTARRHRAEASPPGPSTQNRTRTRIDGPKPAGVLARRSSRPRIVASNDIDQASRTTTPAFCGKETLEDRSDHKQRLIDLLAQASMED